MSIPITSTLIPSDSGPLELLTCLPPEPNSPTSPSPKRPILFVHGASCSASDFRPWLPLFAAAGHPSYALSLRGHGKSWRPSWFSYNFLTTVSDLATDISCAVTHVTAQHRSEPSTSPLTSPSTSTPILVGHSLGGAMIQHALSIGAVRAHKLVLVVSANLEGNLREIAGNWARAEAPGGYAWGEKRFRMQTTEDVRRVFFCRETEESVVSGWIEECWAEESIRAGALGPMWRLGEVRRVWDALEGKRMLCLKARGDVLVTGEMVERNVSAYREVGGEGEVDVAEVSKGGHHVMMDVGSEEAAEAIIRWLSSE